MPRRWKVSLMISLAGVTLLAFVVLEALLCDQPAYATPGYWVQFSLAFAGIALTVVPPTVAMMVDDYWGGDWE